MAHINELMGAGVPWRLARMLGSNRLQTVIAAGSAADTATQLAINFALLATTGPGQGVALDYATGAAVTALYNTGPAAVLIYPAPGDAFNDQAPDLPLSLAVGASFLAVPAVDAWIVVTGANPPLPPAPPAALWVGSGGMTALMPGIGRAFVNVAALVTLILPRNDCMVMDRGPHAGTYPITVAPPSGATINGNPSFVLVSDWQTARFSYDGVNFGVG